MCTEPKSEVSVGIIVLNWNQPALTLEAVKALSALDTNCCAAVDMLIVDNGSSHENRQALQAGLAGRAGVQLLLLNENKGFGAGMNEGVAFLRSRRPYDYFWFLNNDACPRPGALRALAGHAVRNPALRILGATVIDSVRGTVECTGGCSYNSWLALEKPVNRGVKVEHLHNLAPPDFDYIYGAALFVRADFFELSGGFSKAYFLYFEELDLASRCRKDEMAWCAGAYVEHVSGGTSRNNAQVTEFCTYHAALSAFRYTKTHHPAKLPFVMAARILGKAWHAVARNEPYLLRAVAAAIHDFAVGKTRIGQVGENRPASVYGQG